MMKKHQALCKRKMQMKMRALRKVRRRLPFLEGGKRKGGGRKNQEILGESSQPFPRLAN